MNTLNTKEEEEEMSMVLVVEIFFFFLFNRINQVSLRNRSDLIEFFDQWTNRLFYLIKQMFRSKSLDIRLTRNKTRLFSLIFPYFRQRKRKRKTSSIKSQTKKRRKEISYSTHWFSIILENSIHWSYVQRLDKHKSNFEKSNLQ